MSRIAKMPVKIPQGVQITSAAGSVTIKGAKTSLTLPLPPLVQVEVADGSVQVTADSVKADKINAGTTRALINNAVLGVTKGYEKKLALVGVGYRAAAQGKKLNLQVGFSHQIDYPIPDGITVETPTQTEIIVKGASKQLVGQVAAEIRNFRSPEPYKGKGVRYFGERVVMKEAKKK
jgi:large subunit ribosomal protein L6